MKRISKKTIIISLIIALAIIISGIILAALIQKKAAAPSNDHSGAMTNTPKVTDLSKVNALMIPPPNSELDQYKDTSSQTGYLTFETADGGCSFNFGIRSRAQQSGDDLDGMVADLAKHLRGSGYRVDVTTASPLKLADESDSGTTYDFPRRQLLLHANNSNLQALEYFGAVILKSGDRLNTIEVCNDQSGQMSVDQLNAQLHPITDILNHIKLRITE